MSTTKATYAPPRWPVLKLPGQLPALNDELPSSVEPENTTVVNDWLADWNRLLSLYSKGSNGQQTTDRLRRLEDLFLHDGFLKDHFALSSTLRTFHTPTKIDAFLKARIKVAKPGGMKLWGKYGPPNLTKLCPKVMWITAFLTFSINGLSQGETAQGTAMLFLAPVISMDDAKEKIVWKAWSITTTIEDFVGSPLLSLENMMSQSPDKDLSDSSAASYAASRCDTSLPLFVDVIVMGGGQAGLSVGGHLKELGVSRTLVIERFAKAGGTWPNRYEGLKLHTPKRFCEWMDVGQ